MNLKSLKTLYFSLVHSYLTYCNITWGSTNHSKLNKLHSKQKDVCQVIFGVDRYTASEPLLHEIGALDIYKLNIYQVLLFMFKTKHGLSPKTFHDQFPIIQHRYNTRYSENNFCIPKKVLKSSAYSVRQRGPFLWNSFFTNEAKQIQSLQIFKKVVKIYNSQLILIYINISSLFTFYMYILYFISFKFYILYFYLFFLQHIYSK